MTGNHAMPWQARLLAVTAGFVDAFGFFGLNQVFTAHITGNTVIVGGMLAQHRWLDALRQASPIWFFALGIFSGIVLEQVLERFQVRRRFAAALALEAVVLLAFLVAGRKLTAGAPSPDSPFLLVGLLAGAMGVQAVSLRKIHGNAVNTPFVSGMFIKSMEGATLWLFDRWDRWTKPAAVTGDSPDREHRQRMIFYGSIWLAFLAGAIGGGLGYESCPALAILAPLAILCLLIITDVRRPIRDE